MTRNIDKWPYPDPIDTLYEKGDPAWTEVSERIYDDQMGCVPPIRMRGNAFMVGECARHDRNGAIYAAFVELSGRYFARLAPLYTFDPAKYTFEIIRQLEGEHFDRTNAAFVAAVADTKDWIVNQSAREIDTQAEALAALNRARIDTLAALNAPAKWGLFDGRSSSANGGQFVMAAPENWGFQVVDLETGEQSPDYAFGTCIATVHEDTPKFGEWTATARLIVNAPQAVNMLRHLANDPSFAADPEYHRQIVALLNKIDGKEV